MSQPTDPVAARLVGEFSARIRGRLAADVYHHFKDRISVRELAGALKMDHTQLFRQYQRYYPDAK